MTWDAGYTLAVVVGVMVALASNRVGADLVMLGALGLLLVAGIIAPGQAFAGFSNEGLLTVAFLYVVVSGLRNSGVVSLLTARVLGRPSSEIDAQARVILPVTAISAFMNNTPLVAVYLPMLDGFARRYGIAPSRLFLPLSYAAILGGVCTLIGTSTNVVVNGLILEHNRVAGAAPIAPFGMFTITPVGLPVAMAGVLYMLAAGRRVLPARHDAVRERRRPAPLHRGDAGRAGGAGGRTHASKPPGCATSRACSWPTSNGCRTWSMPWDRTKCCATATSWSSSACSSRWWTCNRSAGSRPYVGGRLGRPAGQPPDRSGDLAVVAAGRPDHPRRRVPHPGSAA